MKIKITRSFRDRLNDQVGYIAKDKPEAARNFKEEIIRSIRNIPWMPYKQRKSVSTFPEKHVSLLGATGLIGSHLL